MEEETHLAKVRRKVKTILPDFNVKVTKWVAVVDILAGSLLAVFGVAAILIHSLPSAGSSALITTVPLIVCGVLGLLASFKFKKQAWAVMALLVLSVCSLALCVTVVSAGLVGYRTEAARDAQLKTPHSLASRQALDGVLVALGCVGTVATLLAICLTALALYAGCCKRRTAVRYVSGPDQGALSAHDASESNMAETSMSSSAGHPSVGYTNPAANVDTEGVANINAMTSDASETNGVESNMADNGGPHGTRAGSNGHVNANDGRAQDLPAVLQVT